MYGDSIFSGKSPFALRAFLLGTTMLLMLSGFSVAKAQGKRKFTVSDDIGLTHLNSTGAILFSPDEQYFVVLSERGRLDLNRPESSLRLYSSEDVKHFLERPGVLGDLSAYWTMSIATYKEGPIVSDVRWVSDSSGLVFLAKSSSGNDQLFFADVSAKTVEPLTPEGQHVTAFDVRSRDQFAYCALSPTIRQRALQDANAHTIVGTGRSLDSLIFQEESASPNIWVNDLSELWASFHGKRIRVVDPQSGQPIPIHLEGQRALALSPNGQSVVTALTVRNVPIEWETMYPPPHSTSPYRLRAGQQSPDRFRGQRDVSEYVLIDLVSGKTKPLTHAPVSTAAGWWAISRAAWSSDGRSVVLSDTFLPRNNPGTPEFLNLPCVAVVDVVSGNLSCLERLKARSTVNQDGGWTYVSDVRFEPGKDWVTVLHQGVDGAAANSTTYVRLEDGSWKGDPAVRALTSKTISVDVFVEQGPEIPPVLVASDRISKTRRIIWYPNPQLKGIEMGEVSVFKWKDKAGRQWVGGLYKPPNPVRGKRYPLVIQTHGYDEQEFRPSGSFPTAFAAQELAGVGFVVLQVRDCPIRSAPEEGPCQVAGYEAAVEQLTADGLVDPERVGIIGFSRTCFYVLEALTTSTLHFKAASITDGVNEGYLQYILDVDSSGGFVARDADATIAAQPFGVGLLRWLQRSPEFNMDKITTPLQVVALGRRSVLSMWEPYATLRYLKKPVDLVVLNSAEHILTNPAARMASQNGTIDWLRFWLQDYVDPAKVEQYKSWETMRTSRVGGLGSFARSSEFSGAPEIRAPRSLSTHRLHMQ
jgi:dipeptidyl aminopeptidase/acylaminoacyl peptidase